MMMVTIVFHNYDEDEKYNASKVYGPYYSILVFEDVMTASANATGIDSQIAKLINDTWITEDDAKSWVGFTILGAQ